MPTVSALLKSIQHPIRRKILNERVETISPILYSEFLPLCGGSTGKLNYHFKILDDIVEKLDRGYVLSDKGKNIVVWLNNLVSEGDTNISSRPEVVFSKLVPGDFRITNCRLFSS